MRCPTCNGSGHLRVENLNIPDPEPEEAQLLDAFGVCRAVTKLVRCHECNGRGKVRVRLGNPNVVGG